MKMFIKQIQFDRLHHGKFYLYEDDDRTYIVMREYVLINGKGDFCKEHLLRMNDRRIAWGNSCFFVTVVPALNILMNKHK